MSNIKHEILQANSAYAASFGKKRELPSRPVRNFLILTCIDARLDPAKFAGLAEGDAHVFRNAGGRATDDAIRSLVISHKMLGTREWFVIQHTDCGMRSFDDATIARLLDTSLGMATCVDGVWSNRDNAGGSAEGHAVTWYAGREPRAALLDDVRRIRNHPLVSPGVVVHGLVFDVATGALTEVEEATAIGHATVHGKA